jgi:hypothetical protein
MSLRRRWRNWKQKNADRLLKRYYPTYARKNEPHNLLLIPCHWTGPIFCMFAPARNSAIRLALNPLSIPMKIEIKTPCQAKSTLFEINAFIIVIHGAGAILG